MDNRINKAEAPSDVQSMGESFIRCFYRLLQIPQIHGAENRLSVQASKDFIHAGNQLLPENGEIVLEARHGRLFFSGRKLLMRRQAAIYIFSLLSLFEDLKLSGVKFNRCFEDIRPSQAHALARLLLDAKQKENPAKWLVARFSAFETPFVEVVFGNKEKSRISYAEKAEMAHRIYSFAYNSLKDVSRGIFENRRAGIRKPLRIVQEIVDFALQDSAILLGLSTIQDYDDYTYTHSVNVALLSICLGQQIGLSENSQVFLGVCSLFHDLGKIDIPIEIINKPSPLTEEEFKVVQQHSLNSVRQILKLQASSDLIARIVLGPFEHHLKYDLSGYPEVNWQRPISLFGRIIEICDVYDALTSSRIYRRVPFPQDRALGYITTRAGKDFDPVLVKWFVNMMGIYPIGTFVILDTGEKGLISEGGSIEKNRQPKVLLLKEKKSGQFFSSKVVDLNQRDPETGKYLRTIKSTHHASEFGIQPAKCLMEMEHM
jgi:HD-GYP domain-containing protein (c-di-GMP phosphodiesterase class II)